MSEHAQAKVPVIVSPSQARSPKLNPSGTKTRQAQHMQSAVGNRAVARASSQKPALDLNDPALSPTLPSATTRIQPKLLVNPPADIYEQEADRVAEHVMRMPDPQKMPTCACGGGCAECKSAPAVHKHLQAKHVSAPLSGGTGVPSIVERVIQSPGQELNKAAREFMEPRFGQDFRHVRFHTGVDATESARAMSAMAYTVGNHVVLGANQDGAATTRGRLLLAHELAHVIQQGGMGRSQAVLQKKPLSTETISPTAPDFPSEQPSGTSDQQSDGLDVVAWSLKIDSELKLQGLRYGQDILAALIFKKQPSEWGNDGNEFLKGLEIDLASYVLSLMPLVGKALVTVTKEATKVKSNSATKAFASFIEAETPIMLDSIDNLVDSDGAFSHNLKDTIIAAAKADPKLRRLPVADTAKEAYAKSAASFIQERVRLAVFGDPAGKCTQDVIDNVNAFIEHSWDYFILVQLECQIAYSECMAKNDGWTFFGEPKPAIAKNCHDKWLVYYPMPPGWSGPQETEHIGERGSWWTVSAGKVHPGGAASVEKYLYEGKKESYYK
ncbi:MAG TPA: DUF4157 domain-containing protein [Thermoanaerobaculia bacterium]|jgi:hypothetical protein|nr:DUF4157 domain-containing protein [Thermoanaerobaculia bacterium]